MKKLMLAICLAGVLCAFSAEEGKATKTKGNGKARREMRQHQGNRAGGHQQLTEEQRNERRERFMKMMKEREAKQKQKIIAVLKEAGMDDAKATETAAKIEKVLREGRMGPMMGGDRRPGGRDRGGRRGRGERGERGERPEPPPPPPEQ